MHPTPLQKLILDQHIEPFFREHGYMPTRKQLAERLGQSVSSVTGTLHRMRDRGLIRLHPGWRGIEVVKRGAAIAA